MSVRRLLLVWLSLTVTVASAQNYRGEAIPVIQRVDPIEFSRLRFLTFAFGHEGPMDTPLSTPPVIGREYFVEADIFGIESATTVRFEFLDAVDRPLQTITMWKESDGTTDGEFYGFVKVPGQPFRVAVSGTTRSGAPFRSVLNTLYQPVASGPVEQPVLPAGIPPNQSRQLQSMMEVYRQQLQTRAAQAAAEHPGGVITLARVVVSRIAYEPLNSTSGAPIGIRLRYSMQFPARQTIAVVPHVFPVYQPWAWRSVVAMKALAGSINPAPQMVGVQSLQDVIIYGAKATYQAGVTYSFTMDMVPDYIFKGTQTGRFCIHEQKFNDRTVWNALIASTADVPYSVSISDTETAATIPAFLPQRTFYRSFTADGAFDCGPVPNIRF